MQSTRSEEEPREYVMARVEIDENGCWNWQRAIQDNGYGLCSRKGWRKSAHRYSYLAFRGEIPGGLQLDHLCRNRKCVNPDHLEPVTSKENVMRAAFALHGRNYALYYAAKTKQWESAVEVSRNPRRRKVFRASSEGEARRLMEAWISGN